MRPGRVYRCGVGFILVLAVRSARPYSPNPDDAWVTGLEWRVTHWRFGQWMLGCKHWTEMRR